MKNPLISVIIPIYNGEKFIKRCLDSIIHQSYNKIEIIVINDGSSDNSLNILEKYGNNIKIINQKNKGLGPTRNVGIENVTGDYVMFVDVDDYLNKNSLYNYISEIERNDYDIIIGGYHTFDGKEYKKINIKGDLFSQYNHTEPWNRIYKRDFLVKNKILFGDLRSHEDLVFGLETYSKTDNIKFVEDSGYIYYISNQESITKTLHSHFFEDFGKALKLCCEIESKNKRNKVFAQYKIVKSTIIYLLHCGRHESALSFIKEYNKHFTLMKTYFNIYIIKFILRETFLWNLVILGFLFFDKLHLVKIFAKIYCIGTK